MLNAGMLGRLRLGRGLGQLLLGGEVRPEKRDAERPVGPGKRFLQAFGIIDIGGHNLDALFCQRLRLVRVDIPYQRARSEAAAPVGQDGTDQPTALSPGGTHYRNDLLFRHIILLMKTMTQSPEEIKSPIRRGIRSSMGIAGNVG